MFLPTTSREVRKRGWRRLDVILITGDSYIDSPHIGSAVIGRVLQRAGYRIGIIAQPDTRSDSDILRLGRPRLFWGITAGSVDSMVANYTALGKKRQSDDYTPGGKNDRRPDRALIVYANLIRRYDRPTAPIVLGGLEASLRRISHYDYWSNRVRRSILFDARADVLVYGMGEQTVLALAHAMDRQIDYRHLPGICYIAHQPKKGYQVLPSHEAVRTDQQAFIDMFDLFYGNNDPLTATGLCQQQDTRWLIQNPPAPPPATDELDAVYELPYANAQHPFYALQGDVRALETIRFALATHRGCYGECHFCAISVHQGRTVYGRSAASLIREARRMTTHPRFKGIIHDLGGPTANMYGYECPRKREQGACPQKRCLIPRVCPHLPVNHAPLRRLMEEIGRIPGVRKLFIASGLRPDLILADKTAGHRYLKTLVRHHVSGQLKIAPEHSEPHILSLMGKPPVEASALFRERFYQISRQAGLDQYLSYYLMAAYPGCAMADMRRLRQYTRTQLQAAPEQVQIFTPTPSTYGALMYYTEQDPMTGKPLFVEKDRRRKQRQKEEILPRRSRSRSHRPLKRRTQKKR
ncbi:MAG: YgiQ family radical SAM protein [Desulfobacterales bacterium]